jgi:uncharacterized protein (TIGR03437 family)
MWAEGYGQNLSTATITAEPPFPIILDGITVHVVIGSWDSWAALWFVSPTQVNFQVPCDAPTLGKAMITVMTEDRGETAPIVLDASPQAVGLLQNNGNGTYAQKADGSVVSISNAANPGDVLVFYAVGLGRTTPPATTGEPAPLDQLYTVDASAWRINFNGFSSPVVFAGMVPGFVGLYQLNVVVPADLPLLGVFGPGPQSGKLVIGEKHYDITIITN